MIPEIAFARPEAFWLFLLIPFGFWGVVRLLRRADRWRREFSGETRDPAPFRWALAAFGVASAGIILALAEPSILRSTLVVDRAGMTVVVGLDVSISMLAEDVSFSPEDRDRFNPPNRLNRGRAFALDLLNSLEGERMGLFLFARDGVEVAPPTADYDYLRFAIRHIGTEAVVRPGSDLAAAVKTGAMLAGDSGPRVLVLISDGEAAGTESGDPVAAVRAAGFPVHAVAVGRNVPALIPVRAPVGGDFFRDENGEYLTTRRDAEALRRLAASGGGVFVDAVSPDGPVALAEAIASETAVHPAPRRTERIPADLSSLFLALSALAFAAGLFAGEGP